VTGLASSFDAVAEEYDRHRPAYPDVLVDRAASLAGLDRGGRVLELGCGTGQLTRSLVERGLEVTAVDPGPRLLSLVGQRFAASGRVTTVNARFEDVEFADGEFKAVFCASAFHWLDPDVSWRKVAQILAPGGTLALLTYCGIEEVRTILDQQALFAGLARVAPEAAAAWPTYRDLASTHAGLESRAGNVSEAWAWLGGHEIARPEAARLFTDMRVATMPFVVEHTAAQLDGALGTMSMYSRLTADQRRRLSAENAALEARLGRPIRSSTAAVLVTARLRGGRGE
jgi:SAM-dependent methyltransferase